MDMKIKKAAHSLYMGFALPLKELRRSERNIYIFIIYGLLYDVFLNLYKPFSVKFLERLGGGAFHISLLNSLPGILAVFALIPGSLVISRYHSKKNIISLFFTVSRAFVLLMAFIPFFPESVRPMIFVALLSVMNFPDAVSQSALQSFLGDVFDGHRRSKAIALRNKFGQIFIPAVTLVTGLVVTLIPKTNEQAIIVYQGFFVMAFAVGMWEVHTFRRIKEKEHDAGEGRKGGGLSAIAEALRDKKFISYLLPTLFFYFMFQAGWPLFNILQVIDLQANEIQLALSAVCSGIFGFLGANWWSKLIAKKGNEFATFLAALLLAGTIFMCAAAPNMYVYILIQIYSGATGIGVTIALLNGLLGATPDKNRVVYIAVYNTFINISLGVSPFAANALYNAFGTRLAMAIVGFGRVAAGLLLFLIYLRNRKKNQVIIGNK